MGQTFITEDICKLEIQVPPAGLANLIQNPSGALGAWFWPTPVADTAIDANYSSFSDEWSMRFTTAVTQACYWTTDYMPVAAGQWVKFGLDCTFVTASHYVKFRYSWFDASFASLGNSAQTGNITGTGVKFGTALQAPASTAFVKVRIDLYRTGNLAPLASTEYGFREAMLYEASTSGALSSITYTDPIEWEEILGSALSVKTHQEGLSVGTLSAVIRSAALDPAAVDKIRPGRACRLSYWTGTVWAAIFTGQVQGAKVTYDQGPDVPAALRARIELQALDAVAQLAAYKQPNSVATLGELAALLERAGVPWNIDGYSGQVFSYTVRTVNDNATALDQVALTRDTESGYAWVDRNGVLQVWGNATIPATPYGTVFDEDTYSTCQIDFDTQRCINSVTVKAAIWNSTTLQAEEIVYGPFRDEASIREWGLFAAEFTIIGSVTKSNLPTQVSALATSVLAANAVPELRVLKVSKAMTTAAEAAEWAGVGLYTLVTVGNDESGLAEDMRVVSIEHDITPTKWLVTYGFEADGSVASARFVSPPTAAVRPPVPAQAGIVSSGTFSAVETNNDVAVVFADTYPATPSIVVGAAGNFSPGNVYLPQLIAQSGSGFTVRCRRSTGTGAFNVHWQAMAVTQ